MSKVLVHKKPVRPWIFFVAAASCALFAAAPSLKSLYANGGLYIPGSTFQAQLPSKADVVDHQFRIWNLSFRTVWLHAEPSCGCMSTSWKAAELPPFSSIDVKATVLERSLSTGLPKSVAFRTNLKDVPYVFVYFQAQNAFLLPPSPSGQPASQRLASQSKVGASVRKLSAGNSIE